MSYWKNKEASGGKTHIKEDMENNEKLLEAFVNAKRVNVHEYKLSIFVPLFVCVILWEYITYDKNDNISVTGRTIE